MNVKAIGIRAKTLTPFAYHSVMVQSGTATIPELIGDRAIAFGLASALGMLRATVALPRKDYYRDLTAMPWRTSVFTTAKPALLPPLIRRLNLDEEGGYQKKIQDIVKKGNLATFFQTQEIPPSQTFTGVIFGIDGFDPFKATKQKQLVIRLGLHRNGMVVLEANPHIEKVCLNVATAALFKQSLPVTRYCLHSLQLSPQYTIAEAQEKISQWC